MDPPPESRGSGPRVQAIFTLPLPYVNTPPSSQPWYRILEYTVKYIFCLFDIFISSWYLDFIYNPSPWPNPIDEIKSWNHSLHSCISQTRASFKSNLEKIFWQLGVPSGIWQILDDSSQNSKIITFHEEPKLTQDDLWKRGIEMRDKGLKTFLMREGISYAQNERTF